MQDRLSAFQRELLHAFTRRAPGFYLTGGAALAGYHLGHRTTEDLDFFTATARLDQGADALRAAADEVGATLESVLVSPQHRRFLARRGSEGLVVDLVHDPTPQGTAVKPVHNGVPVDPAAEIMANKLCALLSRMEARDLVDVMALERAGLRVEESVPLAQRKDAGLTAGQLAWVLSQVHFGPDARLPRGVSLAEVRDYAAALSRRMAEIARPGRDPA